MTYHRKAQIQTACRFRNKGSLAIVSAYPLVFNTVSRCGVTGAAAISAFKMPVGDASVRRAVPCCAILCSASLQAYLCLSLNHTPILSKSLAFGGHDDS